MKDKKKIIVPLLLAGVTATGVVSNINQIQQVSVQAAETTDITDVVGAEIKVGRFRALKDDNTYVYQDTFNVGEKIYLPKVDLGDDSDDVTLKYTVTKDKKQFELTDANKASIQDDGKDVYYFTADFEGYYDITISAVNNNKVTTTLANLSVFVNREDATIKLPVNSEYVIPAKVQKGQTNLKIPAPSVLYDKDGEEVEKTAKNLKDGEGVGFLNVYLVNPDGETETPLELDSTGTYYAVDSTKLADVGTYQVVYEYKNDAGKVLSRLESNFQVVNKYDTSSIKLKMVFKSSLSTKGTVNTDISIPKVDVVDENVSSSDAINAFVKVTVKNVKTGVEVPVDYETFTYHPTEEGLYSVKYQAFIGVFGEDCKTSEISPGAPMEVTDNESPTLIPTYAYTLDDDGNVTTVNGETITAEEGKTQKEVAEEKLVNRRVDIPSVAIKGEKFTIPAVYATDNLSEISDITITRTYRSNTGSVSTVTTPANEKAEISFDKSGSAEIRYKAVDKAGNTLGEVVYDVMVYDSLTDLKDGETTLKLNIGTSRITDKEETLTFAKPIATDTYDKYVDVQTYIIYGSFDAEHIEEANKQLLTKTNSDGKYVLDIAEITNKLDELSGTPNQFTILAEATVDSTLTGSRTELKTTKYKTITLQRTTGDESAPTFAIDGGDWNTKLFEINNVNSEESSSIIADSNGKAIDGAGYLVDNETVASGNRIPVKEGSSINKAPFDQGSSILKIPTVVFTDENDSNLSISIEIKDRKGNVIDKVTQATIKKTKIGSGYSYTVSGASFKLSSYGMYTVTFKAKDYAGNIVIRTYGIRVNDKTAPTITVIDEDKFNKEIEVGEYFEVPEASLYKDGEDITSQYTTIGWEIYNVSSGANFDPYDNGFKPTSEGTFFIRYYGEDELGNKTTLEDSLFTITAKDTIKPEISLDKTERFKYNVKWNPEDGKSYVNVDIPVAFATDKYRGQVEVTYTITGPNNEKIKVEDKEGSSYLKTFMATSQGKYKVVYSAVDKAGNEATVEKEICVGDCVAPTITWKNKDTDLKKTMALNEVYEFSIDNFLELEDNDPETTQAILKENVTITLTSPNGTSVTSLAGSEGYKWEFTQTGNYTLKIEVKDKVGNKTSETYTINVPAEDAETNKVSPVLGTVLIVLSVVVLGGVVVYFVASNKKKPTKKSTSKKK